MHGREIAHVDGQIRFEVAAARGTDVVRVPAQPPDLRRVRVGQDVADVLHPVEDPVGYARVKTAQKTGDIAAPGHARKDVDAAQHVARRQCLQDPEAKRGAAYAAAGQGEADRVVRQLGQRRLGRGLRVALGDFPPCPNRLGLASFQFGRIFFRIREQRVGGLFADHEDGRNDEVARNVPEDRRVHYAQSAHAMDAELTVKYGGFVLELADILLPLVEAHPARPAGMMAPGLVLHPIGKRRGIVGQRGPRLHLVLERLDRAVDGADFLHRPAQRLHILHEFRRSLAERMEVDVRCIERVGRTQANRSRIVMRVRLEDYPGPKVGDIRFVALGPAQQLLRPSPVITPESGGNAEDEKVRVRTPCFIGV